MDTAAYGLAKTQYDKLMAEVADLKSKYPGVENFNKMDEDQPDPKPTGEIWASGKHDPVHKDNSFVYYKNQQKVGHMDMPNVKTVHNTGQVVSKHKDYPASNELFNISCSYKIGDVKRNYVLIVEDLEEGYKQWVNYVVPETKILIDVFRELKLPIVWTNWARRSDDGNYGSLDRFYGPCGIKNETNPCYMYGKDACNTIAEIAPKTDEEKSCLINSLHLSKFADKDEEGREILHPMLQAWGVTTIVLLGAWTDDCISATAFEALDRYGYDIIMVKDAVATATCNGNKMRDCLGASACLSMNAADIAKFMRENPNMIDMPKRPLVGSVRFEKPYVRAPEEFAV